MNGNWFWWGGRGGGRGTAALYRQLFDRLVNYHHLNNLVWIWSLDRPGTNAGPFADYFPGRDYFDIAALDVYHDDFQQSYYDDLLKLADGKPVTLAEVGPAPAPSVLKEQPKWTWWMLWAVDGRGMAATNGSVKALVNDKRSLSRDDPEYVKGITPIRAASGLAPLPSASRPAQN
jgi:mannan endo-1,4-beta-mannosidase